MSVGAPDYWLRGKRIQLIDEVKLIDEIKLIDTITLINLISRIGALKTDIPLGYFPFPLYASWSDHATLYLNTMDPPLMTYSEANVYSGKSPYQAWSPWYSKTLDFKTKTYVDLTVYGKMFGKVKWGFGATITNPYVGTMKWNLESYAVVQLIKVVDTTLTVLATYETPHGSASGTVGGGSTITVGPYDTIRLIEAEVAEATIQANADIYMRVILYIRIWTESDLDVTLRLRHYFDNTVPDTYMRIPVKP